jgi:RNA polymerase sigma factor (sigma-70 family)
LLRRFTVQRDADAFELLVRRHGPMVLSVCRRMLRDPHAAEDAFQATFLVLVRKAASLRKPELLGNWLYGVAYRIALRGRLQMTRRVDHEMRTPTLPEINQQLEVEQCEMQAVLDEELHALPGKYRDPLVLCYLQGKTHAQAANILGCPVGSMAGRLATAREKLRLRLKRRGVVTSAGLFGAALMASSARCDVPGTLIHATVQAAASAAVTSSVSAVSSGFSELARSVLGVTRAGLAKIVLAVLLAVLGGGWLTMQLVSRAAAEDRRSAPSISRDSGTAAGPAVGSDSSAPASSPTVSAASSGIDRTHAGYCCGK